MFDRSIRKLIDPALNAIGQSIARRGVSANAVTWIGFSCGCLAALAILQGAYYVGLIFLLLSRSCDGVDGAVVRAGGGNSQGSDLGGFLDIVLDFAFYGLIPFAFILADPSNNAVPGSLLLLVFYVNGASFLTYALMVEKRGLKDEERGEKSLLYTAGLAEGSETIFVFVLFCLFPQWFSLLAYGFSAVVAITTISRFALAYRLLK